MQNGMGRYRWTICSLLFFATTINYLDRSVISLLKPYLEVDFRWTETDYANIIIAFQISYALGLVLSGRFIDKIGTKLGYAIAIFLWSIAAMAHALAKSTMGFAIARVGLGASEAGNFPAAIKTVSEWFPKKERSFATGIFNSGANIGAIVAPLTVPWIATTIGWKWAFIITGAIGFLWLILWMYVYEIPAKNKRLSKEEFIYINSDTDETHEANEQVPKTSWFKLLGSTQTWAFAVGKFLTDPVWWFFLFWLPAFLKAQYNITGTASAFPIALVYTMSCFGSIAGGWLPLFLIKKGWAVFRARKASMLLYAFCVAPVVFAQWLGAINMWLAVIIIGFATAAHQAWSANMYTTVSDVFPKRNVASVIGFGGMVGALGAIIIAKLAGILFDKYKLLGDIEAGYYIMFFICAFSYLAAWLIMHWLVPRMKVLDV
jgi:ACS family hexuronate transporter-like MFS transporter